MSKAALFLRTVLHFSRPRRPLTSPMLASHALTRLLFTEDEVDAVFEEFMAPVSARLDQLLSLPSLDSFRLPAVRQQLIGLLYDLRGVCTGCANRRQYGIFFDWYYPKYSQVLLRALEANRDNAAITSPLLRFYAELVHNKNQRCLFDTASANGILLFREISGVLAMYGSFIADTTIADHRKYELKYKGIKLCLVILKRALSGQYVNFGVFKLYGDKALDSAIAVALKMTMSIPLPDLVVRGPLSIESMERATLTSRGGGGGQEGDLWALVVCALYGPMERGRP